MTGFADHLCAGHPGDLLVPTPLHESETLSDSPNKPYTKMFASRKTTLPRGSAGNGYGI
jgi:hypothetical protein